MINIEPFELVLLCWTVYMIARERGQYLAKKQHKELQTTSEQEEVAEVKMISREEKKEPLDNIAKY